MPSTLHELRGVTPFRQRNGETDGKVLPIIESFTSIRGLLLWTLMVWLICSQVRRYLKLNPLAAFSQRCFRSMKAQVS